MKMGIEVTDSGDSIFPQPERVIRHRDGLTKREFFAGLCLQGICASGDWWSDNYVEDGDLVNEVFAKIAVQQADALIAELNREKEP